MPSSISALNDADRAAVNALLEEFVRAWSPGKLAAMARQLPPPENPLRRLLLLEFIKIDLKRHWYSGQKTTIESYLLLFPELGGVDETPVELVQKELDLRRELGESATWAEVGKRFPRQAAELEQASAAAESAVEALPTLEKTALVSPGTRQLPEPESAPALHEQFGRYRIVKTLGQGGMGTVYLAQDMQLKRPVALKVPHFSAHNAPKVLARFQREAQAAATLVHPNICPVYDVGEIDGVNYLTMAYIEGKPLSSYVGPGQPLPQRRAAERMHRLALALEEAHARGVVHRDLKPSNIMINQRDEPVIMDFGLAHLEQEDVRITQIGAPLGTPSYMAPEQVRGEADAAGPPCDVYSLGVILYELLTGRLPFTGSVGNIMARVLTEQPEPPSKQRPDLDTRLEKICLKAMAKAPAERYPSMADLAADLEEYLRSAPADTSHPATRVLIDLRTQTMPEGSSPELRPTLDWPGTSARASRRNPFLVATGALLLLLPLLAVAVYFLGKEKEKVSSRDEPPATAPSPGTLTLTLSDTSIPVEIHMDGHLIPWSNKPLELSAGTHRLRVVGRDIEPSEHDLAIRPSENLSLAVPLTLLGTVPYPLQDAGYTVAVEVDGKAVPPGQVMRLPVGMRRLKITGKHIDSLEMPISVQPGSNPPLDLRPVDYGFIRLMLDDLTLDVVVDKNTIDHRTLEPLRLPLGPHTLRVSGADIDTITQEFTVQLDKNPPLKIQPVYYGTIRLDWKGSVEGLLFQLDGKPLDGKTVTKTQRLKIGTYSLSITGADLETIKREFTVARGSNEALSFHPVYFGSVKIVLSEPKAEVEVRIDGEVLSAKRREAVRLSVGDHKLHVSGGKYKTVQETFAVHPGANRDRKVTLERRDLFAEGAVKVSNSIDMELIRIPAGKFLMGSPPTEERRLVDEEQHQETIPGPFYMGAYEVKVSEFRAFADAAQYKTEAERDGKGAWHFDPSLGKLVQNPQLTWRNPGWQQEDDFPVVCVSHRDAMEFCKWLSNKEGRTYRLPTEAEWEYACRAGSKKPFTYGDALSSVQANFNGKYPYGDAEDGPSRARAVKAGSFKPNDFGLYDMHGNVWEWCADLYEKKDVENPKTRGSVLRGGSWFDKGERCRSAYRSYDEPDRRYPYVGFRVVAEANK